ncbi:MAG: cob(I)yrinic acid a,c-diamide adenosyltransferase [Chloroflexota bacterium]
MTSNRLAYESAVATGKGDDGQTSLLFGGDRVYKDDLYTEAYGTIDETVAALGIARAELVVKAEQAPLPPMLARLAEHILRIQRELFVVGAELATNPDARERQQDGVTRVSQTMVEGMDTLLQEWEAQIVMPREFIVPGESRLSAALELARTIQRRAERHTVRLARRDHGIGAARLIPYMNRLADLLWILARAAEQAEAREATAARPDKSVPSRTTAASPERSDS